MKPIIILMTLSSEVYREVYRHNDDSEMEWVKPCNRETMKHIIISMTLSSEQNHENTKP